MEEHELKARQLGFESYEEAVYYNEVAGIRLGAISYNKAECLHEIEELRGKEFLNKPKNEQLYELLHNDIELLEGVSEFYFEDEELKVDFEHLEYHILELKKYHLNLQMEQQKKHGSR